MQTCTGARASVCYRHSRWTWAGGRASFAIEQWYYTVAVCRSIRDRAGRVEQAAIGAWRAQDVSGGVEPQHTVQHTANSVQGQGRMGEKGAFRKVVQGLPGGDGGGEGEDEGEAQGGRAAGSQGAGGAWSKGAEGERGGWGCG